MSQIKRKFIEDNAVDGQKARLSNNQFLRGRNAADSADVNIVKVNGSNQLEMGAEVNMGANKITNLANPATDADAVNLGYLKDFLAGKTPKAPAEIVALTALPTCIYDNGASGVGATLTKSTNGAFPVIDTHQLLAGERILVAGQADLTQNGIYVLSDAGSGITPWILTRATDADTAAKLDHAYLTIKNGSMAEHSYVEANDLVTLGTSEVAFVDLGAVGITAGSGIDKVGSVISAKLGLGLAANGVTTATDVQTDGVTTKINGSNQVEGLKNYEEAFTLVSQDITNQYIDLANVAAAGSIQFLPVGGPQQKITTDYTVNYTGGSGGKSRIGFAGGLASGGTSALVAGDVIVVQYQYL